MDPYPSKVDAGEFDAEFRSMFRKNYKKTSGMIIDFLVMLLYPVIIKSNLLP